MISIWQHFEEATRLQMDLVQLERETVEGKGSQLKRVEFEIAHGAWLYARGITPFKTGSLMASHIIKQMETETIIFINPAAVNPFSDEDPPEYGPKVHAMGGHRAFYDRTADEAGPELLETYGDAYVTRLETIL